MVSTTIPHGRILCFLDQSTPVQTLYFSEDLVAPEIEFGTSESVARNSDYYTTEAVGS
jgi:hypothetical protein